MVEQTWKTRNYQGLQSEYSKKFVPLDTQRRKQYGPQQLYEKGTSTFYHETTSRNDYRSWPTEAVYHGKKHDYRPFNATFNYNTTYKHDFENKEKETSVAGRYDPDKNINTMRNKFDAHMVRDPLGGNSTNKVDYIDWKTTTTEEPKKPPTTSNLIHECEFTAKSLYQDDFRKWPPQRTVNMKHEVERSGKRF